MIRRLSVAFTGGVAGALVDSVDIWALGKLGVTESLGIGLRPEFTGPWLYPRLVWGGIWGFLFLLPILRGRTLVRGVLFSLVPTAYVLTVVFPAMGKSLFGLGFGTLTPLLVLVLNFGWGVVASYWYRLGIRQT